MLFLIIIFTLFGLPIVSNFIYTNYNSKTLNVISILLFVHGLIFLINSSNSINYADDKIDILSILLFFFSVYYSLFFIHSLSEQKNILYIAIAAVSVLIILLYIYILQPASTLGLTDINKQTQIDNKFTIREIDYSYGWMDGGTRFVITQVQQNGIYEQFYKNVDCVNKYPMNYTIKIDAINGLLIINNQDKFDVNKNFKVDTFRMD